MPVRPNPVTTERILFAAVLIFTTTDVLLISLGRAPHNRIHTLIVAGLIVLAVKVLLDAQSRSTRAALDATFATVHHELKSNRRATDVALSLMLEKLAERDLRESPTEPIVIRGTAVVRPAIAAPVDPDVIDLARRAQERLNGKDDH